jgi:CheY-like chemotaxis protein
MTLDFKILWIDDQPEYMYAVADNLKTRLAREGFSLIIEWVPRIPKIKDFLKDLQIQPLPDLILLDMNMHDGLKGDELARRLRSTIRYTDVLFYSAASAAELRTVICAQNIDGVYCSHRDNVRTTAAGLIDVLIQKTIDVNHMRGITMSKVGDFDAKMIECLCAWHDLIDDENKTKLAADIIGRMTCFHLGGYRATKKIPQDIDFQELTSKNAFSTDQRRRTLEEILKKNVNDNATDHQLEIFKRFKAEVIDPRNELAHVVETEEDGQIVLIANGKKYDKARLSEVRRGLQEHSENLDNILGSIQRGEISPNTE